jgi:hypothetical protein
VHKSLLNVILHDRLPEHNAERPVIPENDEGPVQKRKKNSA